LIRKQLGDSSQAGIGGRGEEKREERERKCTREKVHLSSMFSMQISYGKSTAFVNTRKAEKEAALRC